MTVSAIGDLILEIYRASRETPVEDFQNLVLGLVGTMVPFNSSRWFTVEINGKQARTRAIHLLNEPQDIVVDWDTVSRQDRFKDLLVAHPGKAFTASPAFFTGKDLAQMRNYAKRYQHEHTLGIVVPSEIPNCTEGLSLFRKNADEPYQDGERHLLEVLTPHLLEALAHNRLLGLRHAGLGDEGYCRRPAALAIARSDGLLVYTTQAFMECLTREWARTASAKLPTRLLEAVTKTDSRDFVGGTVIVSVRRLGPLLFLRARAISPGTRLSSREMAVAELYSQGRSHKEIARQLDLAPATVRNFLQRVYGKLGVGSKIELARALQQGP